MFFHISLISAAHALAIEIQHILNFGLRGGLVDANVTNISHKGEVDDARLILLVVLHELIKAVVLLAIEGEYAVCLLYKL